jgi:hypothetical protein
MNFSLSFHVPFCLRELSYLLEKYFIEKERRKRAIQLGMIIIFYGFSRERNKLTLQKKVRVNDKTIINVMAKVQEYNSFL